MEDDIVILASSCERGEVLASLNEMSAIDSKLSKVERLYLHVESPARIDR